MVEDTKQQFTKYEIARIIGARALQIAMDAPVLLKMAEHKLKELNYDPLEIAKHELEENVLPIEIDRPIPRKRADKLSAVREDKFSDDELAAKEQEVEKEIVEGAKEIGFVNEGEDDEISEEVSEEEK